MLSSTRAFTELLDARNFSYRDLGPTSSGRDGLSVGIGGKNMSGVTIRFFFDTDCHGAGLRVFDILKFTDEQRRDLTRQALACGREYAEKLAAQYGMRDPEKLAKVLGVKVDFPDMPQSTERVLFAEFREPDKVHIYMDGVRKGRILLSEPGVPHALTGQLDIAKLLIGHELFHWVEEKYKKEIWTRTYKIELWAPRPLHNRSGVGVLGEIAAMAFTKTLNNLPYSPYVMDAFLVYGYSPEAASGLYEEMMEKAGRTPRLPEAPAPVALPDAEKEGGASR